MSHMMLEAVIRMPYKMAMQSELSRSQFYSRANQALDEMEAYAAAKVREALQEAGTVADNWAMRHCDDANAEIWAGEAIRALIPNNE